jgi:hypothetical protein
MPMAPSGGGARSRSRGWLSWTERDAVRRLEGGAHIAACASTDLRPGLGPALGCASLELARVHASSSTDARRVDPVVGGAARCGRCVEVRHPASTCKQSFTGRSPVHKPTEHHATTASTRAWMAQELRPVTSGHTCGLTGQRPSIGCAMVCAGHSRTCARAASPRPLSEAVW